MNEKILLIEDDIAIADMVDNHLSKEGMQIHHVGDGITATKAIFTETYDMILLDLMLPGIDGFGVLQKIRERSFVPVLILSAKESDMDKALGLGFGADDYLAKPFSLVELSARIRALLRRATQYSISSSEIDVPTQITIHELTLDLDTLRVFKRDNEIKLTSKELRMLQMFMTEPKRAFSKEQIYRRIWNDDYFADENAIQVHISRLREKIEDIPSTPQYIKTVWGIGYRMGDFM